MAQQPQALDLDAIEQRVNAATPGPWEPRPHQHMANGCRCIGCYQEPTGWSVDHANTIFCDDAVAKLSAAGKTNDFGREFDSCDEGPFLTWADAEFAAHARTDVPALLAEVRRLTAERDQARAQSRRLRVAWNNARSRAQDHAADEALWRRIVTGTEQERDRATAENDRLRAELDQARQQIANVPDAVPPEFS